MTGNCTSGQLALKQWGESAITFNPLYVVDSFTAVTKTMANWGDFLIPFLPQAPEYSYYQIQTRPTNGTEAPLLN